MYVACSTLCFAKVPLNDALESISRLRFAKADLAIHAHGPHLRPADVLADPNRVYQRLKAATVAFAAFHADFGPAPEAESRAQFAAVCRLARLLAVPVVTVPAAPAGSDLGAEAVRLTDRVRLAAADAVILCVETHAGTLTGDPAGAAELCRRVPGLGLTLDPSHYTAGSGAPADYDGLFPLVKHVRLRDSGPSADQFQVRVGQGQIEYGRIVTHLDRHGYRRALAVDIRDGADETFPVEPEVRKLKYLLESLA